MKAASSSVKHTGRTARDRAEKRSAQISAHPLSQAQDSGRKNVMSMRELFCPDPLAGSEKMAGFQIFFCPKIY